MQGKRIRYKRCNAKSNIYAIRRSIKYALPVLTAIMLFMFLAKELHKDDAVSAINQDTLTTGIHSTAVAKDSDGVKRIALTFDDGPHPIYTEKLLDGLSEREIKASFFLLGKQCERYPDIVERIAEEGHLIGNHTYSHIQLTGKNLERFQEELVQTSGIIETLTGTQVTYVRPPFGVWNKKIEESLNMLPVFWNIDPLDWCTSNSDNVCYRVTSKAKDNAIVLLHDSYESTVNATFKIIDALLSEGYEFVTVDELLF